MVACSKLFAPNYASCHEFVHPWTPSCYVASAGLLIDSLPAAFRLYVTVYMLALLMKGRKPTVKDLKSTVLGIIQSSVFISCHAVGFGLTACYLRNVFGHYNFFTFAILPTFISSWFAILMERPSRRALLSLYVTNIASETLYSMLVWRGVLKPIPYADIALFISSVSWLLYLYRGRHDSKDAIFQLIRFTVSPYEQLSYDKETDTLNEELNNDDIRRSAETSFASRRTSESRRGRSKKTYDGSTVIRWLYNFYQNLVQRMKQLMPSKFCAHPHGCIHYWFSGGAKVFAVGCGLEISMQFLMQMKKILKRPKILLNLFKNLDIFRLGAFLGGFSFIYRMTSCLMRHMLKGDSQYIALPAGFLAGFSFWFYRTNTVVLYLMWKSLQLVYTVGLENDVFPKVPFADIFFHCLSTSILFHAALFEPQNLRASYWKFLHNMSAGRMAVMGRECLDVYGLQTSKMVNFMVQRYLPHFKKDFFF